MKQANNLQSIDRIEGDIVVLEPEQNVDISKFVLPVKEGDMVEYIDGKYVVNVEQTELRKQAIRQIFLKNK